MSYKVPHGRYFARDLFSDTTAIGGSRGIGFDINMRPEPEGAVRSLKVWYHESSYVPWTTGRIVSIQVGLTSGRKQQFGEKYKGAKETETFTFSEGEKIVSLKIWPSDHSSGRCGDFELVTDKGRKFAVDNARKTGDAYEPKLGSGILVGMFGNSGHEIDCLGFALLSKSPKEKKRKK
jgi:hypothetical protein